MRLPSLKTGVMLAAIAGLVSASPVVVGAAADPTLSKNEGVSFSLACTHLPRVTSVRRSLIESSAITLSATSLVPVPLSYTTLRGDRRAKPSFPKLERTALPTIIRLQSSATDATRIHDTPDVALVGKSLATESAIMINENVTTALLKNVDGAESNSLSSPLNSQSTNQTPHVNHVNRSFKARLDLTTILPATTVTIDPFPAGILTMEGIPAETITGEAENVTWPALPATTVTWETMLSGTITLDSRTITMPIVAASVIKPGTASVSSISQRDSYDEIAGLHHAQPRTTSNHSSRSLDTDSTSTLQTTHPRVTQAKRVFTGDSTTTEVVFESTKTTYTTSTDDITEYVTGTSTRTFTGPSQSRSVTTWASPAVTMSPATVKACTTPGYDGGYHGCDAHDDCKSIPGPCALLSPLVRFPSLEPRDMDTSDTLLNSQATQVEQTRRPTIIIDPTTRKECTLPIVGFFWMTCMSNEDCGNGRSHCIPESPLQSSPSHPERQDSDTLYACTGAEREGQPCENNNDCPGDYNYCNTWSGSNVKIARDSESYPDDLRCDAGERKGMRCEGDLGCTPFKWDEHHCV